MLLSNISALELPTTAVTPVVAVLELIALVKDDKSEDVTSVLAIWVDPILKLIDFPEAKFERLSNFKEFEAVADTPVVAVAAFTAALPSLGGMIVMIAVFTAALL